MCTASDGLIDPDAFVASASDLDTEQIRTAASSIRAMGTVAVDATEGVASAWQGLSGCYQAPEQEQVYALMDPAVTSANGLATAFGSAAGHLQTYADDLEGHRARSSVIACWQTSYDDNQTMQGAQSVF
ncbi:MAG: hypothetical protein KJ792_12235 [Actinobacteria bacterium]|nr:hypothetical protein [Actinomycetota bacterium]MCG2803590.1 hypothetical protein [Cellulomonas sp.]